MPKTKVTKKQTRTLTHQTVQETCHILYILLNLYYVIMSSYIYTPYTTYKQQEQQQQQLWPIYKKKL